MFRNIRTASTVPSVHEPVFIAAILAVCISSTLAIMLQQFDVHLGMLYWISIFLVLAIPIAALSKPKRPLHAKIKAFMIFCALLSIISMFSILSMHAV